MDNIAKESISKKSIEKDSITRFERVLGIMVVGVVLLLNLCGFAPLKRGYDMTGYKKYQEDVHKKNDGTIDYVDVWGSVLRNGERVDNCISYNYGYDEKCYEVWYTEFDDDGHQVYNARYDMENNLLYECNRNYDSKGYVEYEHEIIIGRCNNGKKPLEITRKYENKYDTKNKKVYVTCTEESDSEVKVTSYTLNLRK